MKIYDTSSVQFKKYGKLLDIDFLALTDKLDEITEIPQDGNIYIPSEPILEEVADKSYLDSFYGGMPYQVGYCNGKNQTLNGLEYHKGSEINVATTDIILLLGCIADIENETYQADKVEAFLIKKGEVVEIYATTLHFAPCKVEEDGFKTIVILSKGTNEPLTIEKYSDMGENKLLFATNKWLLVHKEREVLVKKGAHIGILGENIKVDYQRV